jgi:DNA polymerase elongation subunit (family B)
MAIIVPAAPVVPKPSALAPTFTETPLAAKHICFDIETGNADADGIETSARYVKAASNIKDPVKAEKNLADKRAKLDGKAALLDSAPIACMAFVTEAQSAVFYHVGHPWPKGLKPVKSIKGCEAPLFGLKDEREMLMACREWMDKRGQPVSVLIGHNLEAFDLPKIRIAFVRHNLRLPLVLQPEARDVGVEVYDTQHKFLRFFTAEKHRQPFISLEEMEARLGLPSYKDRVSGAEVPGMVAKGQLREVLTYMWLDALSTYAGFRAMTGQRKDLA